MHVFREIYDMELHEYKPVGNHYSVLRVAGGWVYSTMNGAVFVPLDNEYQKKPKTRKG